MVGAEIHHDERQRELIGLSLVYDAFFTIYIPREQTHSGTISSGLVLNGVRGATGSGSDTGSSTGT